MARISAHGKMGRNVAATPRLSLETLLRESQQPSISCLLVATMKFGRDFCNTQIGDIIGRHIQHFPNQTFAHGVSSGSNPRLGYPFNFVAQGIGTRRPCVMTLTPDPEREKATSWRMTRQGWRCCWLNMTDCLTGVVSHQVSEERLHKGRRLYITCWCGILRLQEDEQFLFDTKANDSFQGILEIIGHHMSLSRYHASIPWNLMKCYMCQGLNSKLPLFPYNRG